MSDHDEMPAHMAEAQPEVERLVNDFFLACEKLGVAAAIAVGYDGRGVSAYGMCCQRHARELLEAGVGALERGQMVEMDPEDYEFTHKHQH